MTDKDLTDDWMEPWARSWPEPKREDPKATQYLIERAERQICFGSPGSIVQWKFWSRHETAEERDAELARLHEAHPMWHLRARDRVPWLERAGIYPGMPVPGINPKVGS